MFSSLYESLFLIFLINKNKYMISTYNFTIIDLLATSLDHLEKLLSFSTSHLLKRLKISSKTMLWRSNYSVKNSLKKKATTQLNN